MGSNDFYNLVYEKSSDPHLLKHNPGVGEKAKRVSISSMVRDHTASCNMTFDLTSKKYLPKVYLFLGGNNNIILLRGFGLLFLFLCFFFLVFFSGLISFFLSLFLSSFLAFFCFVFY